MKNKLTLFLALTLVLFVAIGCSFGNPFGSGESDTSTGESKSAETKEAAPSGEVVKVGIKECDELATYINDNSEKIEGSYLARGIVYLYKNYMLESIRDGVENMTEEEKIKLGKACKQSMDELKKSL
jgi:hypothetical protein